jgi:predicted TIM-barrel fold metal-dependent hydrolase
LTSSVHSSVRSVSSIARKDGHSILAGLQGALAELRTSSSQWHVKLIELLRLLEAVDAVIDHLGQPESRSAMREAVQTQRRALIQAAKSLHQQIGILSRVQGATDGG